MRERKPEPGTGRKNITMFIGRCGGCRNTYVRQTDRKTALGRTAMVITQYIGITCATLPDGTQYLQQGCTVWVYATSTDVRGVCLAERTDGTQDGLLRLIERVQCQQAQVEGAIHHGCGAALETVWGGPMMSAYRHGHVTGHDVCGCEIIDIHGRPLPDYRDTAVSV